MRVQECAMISVSEVKLSGGGIMNRRLIKSAGRCDATRRTARVQPGDVHGTGQGRVCEHFV